MLFTKIDNTKFETESLQKLHSVLVIQDPRVKKLMRYYYAGSSLVLEMDLKPLLEVDEETTELLFCPAFRKLFPGKSYVEHNLMDRLIMMVALHNEDACLDPFYANKVLAVFARDKYHRCFIDDTFETSIFLQESTETISRGTTGLSSWIACYFLANYLIECEKLDGQTVVELGAGCGLAGIVASKYHRLKSLVTTDCDVNVLNQLKENVKFNFGSDVENVKVQFCDWNDSKSVDELPQDVDLVIASDVVYDPELIKPLVRTLETLSSNKSTCRILIAGQERNPETLQHFMKAIYASKLQISYTIRSVVDKDDVFIKKFMPGQQEAEVESQLLKVSIPPPQPMKDIRLFELRLATTSSTSIK